MRLGAILRGMGDRALVAVPDLMFQPRIEAVLRSMGFETAIADSAVSARDELARRPALVVVDIDAKGLDTEAVIRGAKQMKAQVIAFGRHTEPGALRAARNAGADRSVPRSQLVEELPELVREVLGMVRTADG